MRMQLKPCNGQRGGHLFLALFTLLSTFKGLLVKAMDSIAKSLKHNAYQGSRQGSQKCVATIRLNAQVPETHDSKNQGRIRMRMRVL